MRTQQVTGESIEESFVASERTKFHRHFHRQTTVTQTSQTNQSNPKQTQPTPTRDPPIQAKIPGCDFNTAKPKRKKPLKIPPLRPFRRLRASQCHAGRGRPLRRATHPKELRAVKLDQKLVRLALPRAARRGEATPWVTACAPRARRSAARKSANDTGKAGERVTTTRAVLQRVRK